MKELLARLAGAFGPSGSEDTVRSLIKKEIEGLSEEVFEDNLGNLVAFKGSHETTKIMVAAHMDEIGFMVIFIDDNGFLRFTNIGGVLKNSLVGSSVVFQNGTVGVIAQEKIKDRKELDYNKMFIDIGARNKEEAQEKIKIGDTAVFSSAINQEGTRLMGKSMDNRVGCALLIEAMRRLPASLPQGVNFVFTVQEEVGLRGARPASYSLKPHYGLAVDVTRVGDTPEPEYKMDVSLGKGPAVKVKDSSIICHPKVIELMVKTAEKNNIPFQMEVLERGGTDAGAIHLSREGIPSGVLSIPCRYIHTATEMVDLNDLENGVMFLVELLKDKWPSG